MRVGDGGEVFAVDLQQEMLEILQGKLQPEGLMSRIRTHHCKPDSINLPSDLNGTFDGAFTIFVVHEVPDPARLFREISALLKPGGFLFYTEPPLVVSGSEFRENLGLAERAGFRQTDRFLYFVNRTAVLRKE
jgi:ubiquinone/menaquinone biosynthesis C-methylase UbiE